MATERLLGFGALAVVLILIPGPSVLFIVGRALSIGRRGALLTVVANTMGQYLQVVAVAMGIGALVESSALAFMILKLVGATYLIVLGVRTWLGRGRGRVASTITSPSDSSSWAVARGGLVVGLTNPKTAVFFAAVLPQFVARGSGHVPLQILVLGLIWVGLVLIGDSAWALGGAGAGSWLSRSPRRASTATGASGLLIAGLGVALAFTGNRG